MISKIYVKKFGNSKNRNFIELMNYAPADFHLTKSSKFCFNSKIEFLFNNKNLIQDFFVHENRIFDRSSGFHKNRWV